MDIKEKSIDAWLLAVRNFLQKEETLEIEGISFRIFRFDHDLYDLGCLSEIIIDDPQSAVGVIWVNSGLDSSVPCIIYDCSRLAPTAFSSKHIIPTPKPRSSPSPKINLINAIEHCLVDAKFAGCKKVAIFESRYNSNCIGWMLEEGEPLRLSKKRGWLPSGEDARL